MQDEQLAITWLERAAAQNHAGALYNLVNGDKPDLSPRGPHGSVAVPVVCCMPHVGLVHQ